MTGEREETIARALEVSGVSVPVMPVEQLVTYKRHLARPVDRDDVRALTGAIPMERRLDMLGLRTAVYHVDDLDAAKEWYGRAFDVEPHFDEPFYVGFDVGGCELGLVPADPDRGPGIGGVDAYWGVEDVDAAHRRLLDAGAEPLEEIRDVGEGIRTATVVDPFGNPIGIVENPNFGAGAGG